MSLASRFHRATVFAVALTVGVGLGGLQSHTALYPFSPVPGRFLLVAAALAGPVLYWWCRGIGEVLAAFSTTIGAAFVSGVAAQSGPMFVGDLPLVERNAVLINAISEGIVYTALTGALLGAGIIVTAIGAHEIGVPPALATRGRRLAVVATVVFVLAGTVLGGVVAGNYAAAVEQRDVSAEVTEVGTADDAMTVTIILENRLPSALHVESLLLEIEGDASRATSSTYPDRKIRAGNTGDVRATVSCEVLDDATVSSSAEVTLSGHVYVTAFNDYEQRVPIAERSVSQPC